jgi:excisionase family DNA binding protein
MAALLTPDQVAVQLGVEVKTLYNWRSAGTGPVALKVGKYLRYEPAALDAYLESLRPHSNVTPIRRQEGR